jgi:hypothetical protein
MAQWPIIALEIWLHVCLASADLQSKAQTSGSSARGTGACPLTVFACPTPFRIVLVVRPESNFSRATRSTRPPLSPRWATGAD